MGKSVIIFRNYAYTNRYLQAMKIMKKTIILIIFVLVHVASFGQSKTVILDEKGDSIDTLIPKNWEILSTSTGDLNKDGINDLVFAVQNTDKNNFKLNDGLGRDTINLNPRILGIYFRNKNGQLIKKLQSDEFIILQDSPTMDEPFDGVEILKNGILKIDFRFWFSAGSWSMSNHSYKFKFQNEQFELTGYESSERHRGTGATTDYSINFSTRNMNISRMTIDENNNETIKKESKKFKLDALKSIQSLGKPFEWEFHEIYL